MNRWLMMAVIVVVAIVLDISTKTWAENHLASQSRSWIQALSVDVGPDDYGMLVSDFVIQTWDVDANDPVEAPAIRSLYQVDPTGERQPSLMHPDTILDDRVSAVELRYRAMNVVDGFWSFSYAENTGAAFGFLSGKAEAFRRPFFLAVSVLAMIMIMALYRKVPDDRRLLQLALASVVGGAIGNFIDRVRYGYVVDFVDWYITIGGQEKHWPTFNVADVFISCGVTVMAVLILLGHADFDAPAEPADKKTPKA